MSMRLRGFVPVVGALAVAACSAAPKLPPPRTGVLAAPKVQVGDLDARVVLGEVPAKALKAGAGPVTIVAAATVVDGERLGAFVELPSDVCLLAYARGATTIEDVDIAVFGEDGAPIVVDESPDAHPTVLLCPPHPDRVYVAAHISTGDGLVAIGAHLVARDKAVDTGRALGARGGDGQGPRSADAWPGIDDIARAHRERLGGKWEEFRKVAVTVDPKAPTFVAFPLEAERCTDAVVVPDDEVGVLEVEVADADGRILARSRDGGRARTVTVCSPATVTASLAVRPHAGRGLAAVVLAKARSEVLRDLAGRGDVAWVGASRPMDLARTKVDEELVKGGYERGRILGQGALAVGRRGIVPYEIRVPAAGRCERIDVIGGAPLALVDAALWDDGGALLASAQGSEGAVLFACGKAKGRLELDARGRPGPFVALGRPEPWQHQAFGQSPVAASRMLTRLAATSSALTEGAAAGVRTASLEQQRRTTWERTVPPGKCLRVAAGAVGDGTGLVLRLFDGATDEELDRSHGTLTAGTIACAGAAPRNVRGELAVTSGRLEVVIGERLYP